MELKAAEVTHTPLFFGVFSGMAVASSALNLTCFLPCLP